MNLRAQNDPDHYAPDHRLTQAYDEATLLDEDGLQALCPSYIELAEVDARYQDEGLLGKGAIKEVHRTFDRRTKRWIAMARLRTDRGPEYYDTFVHEAWLTSSLSHPNIIKIHDAGVDSEGRPFFTMDLKGNRTLKDFVKSAAISDRRTLLYIFIKICDAVAYAHSRGIIHLDLKPENIQTDNFGEVLVCDWGLGKVIGEMEEGETEIPLPLQSLDNMTLLGQIKGTPGFMAPEQAVSGTPKDRQADIFALGCVLHLILTGESPFTGPPAKALDATIRANVVPPRMKFPHLNIPESLEAVIMKATARIPEERYDSALEVQKEIQNYLGGYSTQAENPGSFREARLFLTRNRIPAAITSLALVVFTILSVLFIQRLSDQRAATAQESERASQFASEAETASSLYEGEVAQSAKQRKQLAEKLAGAANSIKNLGIFDRPVPAIREAHNLAATALDLDPNCSEAKFQRFSLNCLTLDFKAALTDPPNANHKLAKYLTFCRAFPNFDFTQRDRPSIERLVNFLRRARELNPNYAAFMERIVCFDFATRPNKSTYHKVVTALLEYRNGGNDHLTTAYDEKKSSFLVWSNQKQPRLMGPNGGSFTCLLRFLRFRSLQLDFSGKFDLSDLQELPIEILDLRKCKNLVLTKATSLPALHTIHVRPGQIDPKLLRNRIVSSETFKIVTEADAP